MMPWEGFSFWRCLIGDLLADRRKREGRIVLVKYAWSSGSGQKFVEDHH